MSSVRTTIWELERSSILMVLRPETVRAEVDKYSMSIKGGLNSGLLGFSDIKRTEPSISMARKYKSWIHNG
jgi:hypothetical protein